MSGAAARSVTAGLAPAVASATDRGSAAGICRGERPILRRIGLARAIEILWKVSERETGVVLDVAAAKAALQQEDTD